MYIKRITNQLPVQKIREAIEYKTKNKLHSNTCGYIMKIKKKTLYKVINQLNILTKYYNIYVKCSIK